MTSRFKKVPEKFGLLKIGYTGFMERFFKFSEHGTTLKTEVIAGSTTFITMAYIMVVNPAILEVAGIPKAQCTVATILTAFIGTLLMGLYANRPFAIAPYMGQNAFVAFTVCRVMGYSWQVALGGIFISAVIFALLTVLKVRSWLVESIPDTLKIAFSGGIGLFLTFIGLNESGLVTLGVPGAPVQVGNILAPTALLALFGFALMAVLLIRKTTGAFLISILTVTLLSVVLGYLQLPSQVVSPPPSLDATLWQMDIWGSLQPEFWPILLIFFVIIFTDTMGTLIGISYKGGFLDKKGNLPEIEKPMLCDSIATMAGAAMGTTTAGAYIESAAGIEAGGRTGFASVVTAVLFLIALFFVPLFTIIPGYACGPALMMVGMLMFSPIRALDFDDLTVIIPVFTVIAMTCFTYNLGVGMTAGFIAYPLVKLAAGRAHEIPKGLWLLTVMSVVFFAVYPYAK